MMAPDDISPMKPVTIPISDELDLHTFNPKEIPGLLRDYFTECRAVGIFSIRVIHGKGTGILKNRVRAALKKMPGVADFADAPPEAGGWGATVVNLRR